MGYIKKCGKCKKEFHEKDLEISHDVPCYLFLGNRRVRKNQADKFGSRYLCKKHHKEYDDAIREKLIIFAKKFSEEYFKKEDESLC